MLPEILFITTFPPKEYGITNYFQDLIDSINKQFENDFVLTICALESEKEQPKYSQQIKYILNTDEQDVLKKQHLK